MFEGNGSGRRSGRGILRRQAEVHAQAGAQGHATDLGFKVTRDPWSLCLEHQEYGSFGYQKDGHGDDLEFIRLNPLGAYCLGGGHDAAELRDFLDARDEQPLPETVEAFLRRMERGATALTQRPALLSA